MTKPNSTSCDAINHVADQDLFSCSNSHENLPVQNVNSCLSCYCIFDLVPALTDNLDQFLCDIHFGSFTSQSYKKKREGQEKVKCEKFDNLSCWCVRKFRWQSSEYILIHLHIDDFLPKKKMYCSVSAL